MAEGKAELYEQMLVIKVGELIAVFPMEAEQMRRQFRDPYQLRQIVRVNDAFWPLCDDLRAVRRSAASLLLASFAEQPFVGPKRSLFPLSFAKKTVALGVNLCLHIGRIRPRSAFGPLFGRLIAELRSGVVFWLLCSLSKERWLALFDKIREPICQLHYK